MLNSGLRDVFIVKKLSKMVCFHQSEWGVEFSHLKSEIDTFLDKGINKEEDEGIKNILIERKNEALQITEAKVNALSFWKEVKVSGNSMPEGVTYEPHTNSCRKMHSWETEPILQPGESPSTLEQFPTNNKVYHFHPNMFVRQMRRLEDDPSLIWGAKVSLEFRKKVGEISKRLKCDPNHLMTCMALETGGTFDPSITNSLGYTGLIQIGTTAAKDISRRKKITVTTDDLRKMSAVEQLTYVEYYLEPFKGRLNCLAAFYLAILYPADIKHANNDNHVVFDKNSSSIIRKKAYSQNPLFHNESPESGKTYVWEIRAEIDKLFKKGEKYKN